MKMNMGMMKRTFGSLKRGGGANMTEGPMPPQKVKSKNPPRKMSKKK